MLAFWTTYLVTPLFNILIWLYNTIGFNNLGLAIIWLTIAVRFVLIPFSFFAERNQAKYDRLGEKWHELERDIPHDLVLRRELLRAFIKKQRISPWARMVLLGTQLFVLVLLYQVFIGGFVDPQHFSLYGWVARPIAIETSFFGLFDVAEHNIPFAAFVGFIIFLTITFEQRTAVDPITRSSLWFRIFFPIASAVLLALLPAVKSLFILTSIAFTGIFHLAQLRIDALASRGGHVAAVAHTEAPENDEDENQFSNPWHAFKKEYDPNASKGGGGGGH